MFGRLRTFSFSSLQATRACKRSHVTTPSFQRNFGQLFPSNPHVDISNHTSKLPPPSSLTIIPNFLSPAQQALVTKSADKKLRRLCGREYWNGHFDGVIEKYRECSVGAWSRSGGDEADIVGIVDEIKKVVEELVEADGGRVGKWLDPHILDLGEGGEIRAHVDNVQASGTIITGLCLLSPAVIIFRQVKDPTQYFSALLEPGSLYIQRDALRFDYTHEIPDDPTLRKFKGDPIPRGRRISIMMRNEREVV
ncbi:hypothetical protein SpCBS45565_g02467 [Spizellomyces sp. 'palustris']|nr:hypothetical protein SpCBS45565_g02467 [Spizellomyces sp. 'palustris']